MIPQAALDLILGAEGVDQPKNWPRGDSGITLGHGYDLSAETAEELKRDWTRVLGEAAVAKLLPAVGKRGLDAARLAPTFFNLVRITPQMADQVFMSATLPKYEAQTAHAFPGVETLPDLVRGALVSLVYNRGTSMDGDRRREMLLIRNRIAYFAELSPLTRLSSLKDTLAYIAAKIRAMKRLWVGQGLDGLLTRREAEARLVESAIPA